LQTLDKAKSSLLKRLWHDHICHYKKLFAMAIVAMIFTALATAALPYLLQPVFDEVFQSGNKDALFLFCGSVLVAFIVKGVGSFGEAVSMNYVGQRIIADIQHRLFKHLMNSDLHYFQSHHSGILISHFTNDVNLLRNAVAHTIVGLGKDSLTLFFLIALMFYRDLSLALATFVLFPTLVYPITRLGKRLRKVSHSTQEHMGEFTGYLSQIFQGVRVVKAYSAEAYESLRAQTKIQQIFRYIHKANVARALSHPIVEIMGGLAIVGVIAYGGYQVGQGERTTGEFVSFIAALILAYEPMKRLSNMNANLQEGLAAAKRIYTILDTHPLITEKAQKQELNSVQGKICFDNVSFSYLPDHPVLQGISFTLEPGKTAAVVGPSGAGKSTLINLVQRFYDVGDGAITIDGHDLRDLSFTSLRHNLALVSQEIVLFDESVTANVTYGFKDIDETRVHKACKDAAAEEFIKKLPHKYDTKIGENGNKLSGGQRQRLAIARAMYKDSKILLLDEATSALDSESEKKIQAALKKLMHGRTTLIVAHRLSTIVDADVIYVMDQGRIVEQGSHSQLLKKKGLYAQLWQMQGDGTGDL